MPRSRSSSSFSVGDLLVALEQHLAGLRDPSTSCADDAPDDLFERDRDLLDAGLLHLAERRLGELAAFLDDELVALGMADVAASP